MVAPIMLAGCAGNPYWLADPRGPLASADLHSWLIDTAATFLVIGPTTLLVSWCLWRYRRAARSPYTPGWSHSLRLEAFFWGFPLFIVLVMGFIALRGALAVDPGDPGLMAPGGSRDADHKPIDIDVITTDWQWMFVYPDDHVAAANELVVPVDTPIRFRLTSSTVVADFFIPQLVGQIDVMPGMRTRQAMIAYRTGDYDGFSSDYTGPGFAWMGFKTHVVSAADYTRWIDHAAHSTHRLDEAAFERFAQPTINKSGNTIEFSDVTDGLFDHVVMDVMNGKTYPTPPDMTEKKPAGQPNTQPTHEASPS